jgi:hypothetical protein
VNPSRAGPSSYCGHIAAEKCDEASSSARIERTAGMKPMGSFVRSQGLARGGSEVCLVHAQPVSRELAYRWAIPW